MGPIKTRTQIASMGPPQNVSDPQAAMIAMASRMKRGVAQVPSRAVRIKTNHPDIWRKQIEIIPNYATRESRGMFKTFERGTNVPYTPQSQFLMSERP